MSATDELLEKLRTLKYDYDSMSTSLEDAIDDIAYELEQAIAATLGRRECKLRDCEGSFSAVNRPVWLCDCGAFMTQYTDATTYHKPNYCPNCGARVERREQ